MHDRSTGVLRRTFVERERTVRPGTRAAPEAVTATEDRLHLTGVVGPVGGQFDPPARRQASGGESGEGGLHEPSGAVCVLRPRIRKKQLQELQRFDVDSTVQEFDAVAQVESDVAQPGVGHGSGQRRHGCPVHVDAHPQPPGVPRRLFEEGLTGAATEVDRIGSFAGTQLETGEHLCQDPALLARQATGTGVEGPHRRPGKIGRRIGRRIGQRLGRELVHSARE